MHGKHADRALGDSLAGILRIDGIGVIDVTEDRPSPRVDHGLDAGEGGQGGDEDFVARLQALRDVQEMDGGRPGR